MQQSSVLPVDITEEVQASYLDYAMSVIVSRALPDVRDGLKPVHRRILYSMYISGFLHDRPYKKSARTIGDVVGKYHPHGDSAVYDSLVRMAQNFSMRAPLIDGQGNFGSIDGDPPAAMRYTEARLAKIASKFLEDIHLGSVDFRPNYDGSEQEPVVLPAVVPNLLLNGSGGIAVGMATNIPPHNLAQVIDACCLYIDDKEVAIDDLIKALEGPDFPTQGSIVGIANLHKAYKTGRGVITIKGKAEVEERPARHQAVIITEIPYAVNKARFVERVAELAKEGRIEGISDLRDESDSSGIRVVVDLKREAIASVVINQLYNYSQLKVSYGMNILALDKGVPKLMNLKEIIAAFVNFRREVIYRRTSFLLSEAKKRGEVLVGLLVAIENVDQVVKIIRESKDVASAREQLMSISWEFSQISDFLELLASRSIDGKFRFSEVQAKAILEMRLARLTGLEKKKISQELITVAGNIKEYNLILSSSAKLMALLKEELLAVKAEFATPRLTKIDSAEEEPLEEDDLIPEEEMVVTFTLTGYIKRVHLSTYVAQKRGGKGKLALQMVEDDAISNIIVASTHADLLFFSDLGQVYKVKLHKLPLASIQSKGKPIANLLPIGRQEKVNNVLPRSRDRKGDLYVVFATARGQVRRNKISDFDYIPANGKIAIRLEEGDKLISVRFSEPEKDILLATSKGKCIRFSIDDLRVFKSRSSDGVRGIKISSDDKVVGQVVVSGGRYNQEERELYLSIPLESRLKLKLGQQDLQVMQSISGMGLSLEMVEKMAQGEEFVLAITENGYAKCTSAYEYRRANRGGSGVVAISSRVGRLAALELISGSPDEELMVITNLGKVIRCKVGEIRITGRNTSGVILVKMKKGEKVVSAALIGSEIGVGEVG